MAGGYRLMKRLKGPSGIWFFPIQTREEQLSMPLVFLLNLFI